MSPQAKFPLIDAFLQLPEEGEEGRIGICTNSTAPGEVLNELETDLRQHVSVLGSLIVNRDGAERMILNSLVHPTLQFLILFAEEGVTFSPSSNLLAAIQLGFDEEKKGNYIKEGRAASPHYPNISAQILDRFREEITVLPAYVSKSSAAKKRIAEYLEWLKTRIDPKLYELLKKINQKDKIYYDALKQIIKTIATTRSRVKRNVELDAKDFQQLQPPRIQLENLQQIFSVPFKVSSQGKNIHVDIKVGDETFAITADDDFLLAYSLMKHLGDKKKLLSPLEQLLLGAELGLMKTRLSNDIDFPSIVRSPNIALGTEIPLEPRVILKDDTQYYYRVGIDKKTISVMCMAFDMCNEVFDLRCEEFAPLIQKIAELNRFEDYEMDFLHRMDIGAQIARAYVAAKQGYSFMQDFSSLFKVNTTELPLVIADEDTFLAVHKSLLRQIYIRGLTEQHGDPWKGLARTAIALAVYRNSKQALAQLPQVYKQGEQSTEEMRAAYQAQLLRFDHDGSYSYGERTRTFFGFDQLPRATENLQKDPIKATIIQRFDPAEDMGTYTNPDTGKPEFTHDPCLTHDIYFVRDNKLYGFHIARAHNIVNAYPENIFGLFDAYSCFIANSLGIEHGDEFMLSSRANILLLTEEQRTKKILAEPSKPSYDVDTSIGPYLLGENVKKVSQGAVAYYKIPATTEKIPPQHPFWEKLTHYQGQDIVKKAITYLKEKGVMHNNPLLSCFNAKIDHLQSDTLVFFQANVLGKQVHGTAVFANRSLENRELDKKLLNYLLTMYSETLGFTLGDLTCFYINY